MTWLWFAAWAGAVEPPSDTGTPDTGAVPAGDSGMVTVARSAAELAGEVGGCRCASPVDSPSAWWMVPLGGLLLRRRRSV